ncbi:SH3 domain-containing protein [Anaerococcus sp. AGMB00486]|uniref:SH3 domain-containing protein n=1 Tax=Anaerococcus faecalis TaxID=2742993 RepID=A0ABX2NA60_9FIRM|nr:SH3 domain-containing protein [Anaerococcus faecalis]NVF11545.1 SH3 domain-containing protein [Anaerococcus faecalis]
MNLKKVILSLFLIIILASCSKKEESYEKRDVKIDSVFDNVNLSKEDKKDNEAKEDLKEDSNKVAENQDKADESTVARTNAEVNLRESPTTKEDNFITSLPNNAEVNILEEVQANGEAWLKISYKGREGFVKSDFVNR